MTESRLTPACVIKVIKHDLKKSIEGVVTVVCCVSVAIAAILVFLTLLAVESMIIVFTVSGVNAVILAFILVNVLNIFTILLINDCDTFLEQVKAFLCGTVTVGVTIAIFAFQIYWLFIALLICIGALLYASHVRNMCNDKDE